MSGNEFHITVATTPSRGLDLTKDLQLLKAALLYADKVRLCSFVSTLMIYMAEFANIREDEQLDFLVEMAEPLGFNAEEFRVFSVNYRNLRDKKRRNRQELILYRKLQQHLKANWKQMRDKLEEMAIQARVPELTVALQTGMVELELLDINSETVVEEFFDTVGNSVVSGETYPLFDDSTGRLVNSAIQEGLIDISEVSKSRAKQVGLSSDLLSKLPIFDDVPMDQVIDIRKELDKPLIRFRSAVIGYSDEIESIPWEEDFPKEAENTFRKYVEPAILDLEEAVRSNSFLLRLEERFRTQPVITGGSVLGIIVSQAANLPEIADKALTLSSIAGVASVGLSAYRTWREKQQEIERNQLFFYYQASKMLRKKN